jgi:DNA-binding MarR family transcriptional regulator
VSPASRSVAAELAGSADDIACTGGEGIDADLGWALAIVSRAFRLRAGESMADLPGGPRGFLVLTAVAQGPPRSQLALAQQLGVDKTVMTYLLDVLETAGVVTRRPDPADRRARQIAITAHGSGLLLEFGQRLAEAEHRLLASLSDAEGTVFRDLLGRVARSAQSDVGSCLTGDVPADGDCC